MRLAGTGNTAISSYLVMALITVSRAMVTT